jgi:sucrose phosphorylase
VDVHQINCTFYDALGRRDDEYLVARAIQCFVPGIPQIYYVGLLAGGNDMELLRRTGVGRDINRHYYVGDEVARAMDRPVVQALCGLLRFRHSHPSFAGTSHVSSSAPDRLVLEWRNGSDWSRLDVDLGRMRASIVGARAGGPSAMLWAT